MAVNSLHTYMNSVMHVTSLLCAVTIHLSYGLPADIYFDVLNMNFL